MEPESTCETHPERAATHSIVGECDSFGYETINLCDECYAKTRSEIDNPPERPCDWCKTLDQCSAMRDPDEGYSGPVYYVCKSCRTKHNQRLQEEADHWYNNT